MHTREEITEFCNIVSKCHAYPFHYFHNQELTWERPSPPADLISGHLDYFYQNSATMSILQTSQNLAFGYVRTSDYVHMIIIGPVPLTMINFENIHGIMKEYQISADDKELLLAYLGRTSGYSLPHLQNVLSLVNFYVNENDTENTWSMLQSNDNLNHEFLSMSLESSIKTYNASAYQAAYNYEKETLAHVKNGNVKGILDRSSTSMDMHVGIMSTSTLRQLKDIFICTTTLVTRAAIEGGLNLKTAYQLSDLYLQRAENTTNSSDMKKLSNTMVLDFTERTNAAKQKEGIPFDIFECLQYIRQNTHIPLRVEMLAAYMNLSKSQLDRKFKSTLGFSPSEFIMRCKLEEAKDLLLNTNRPLSEISQILCFSSQSHFSNTFKKQYKMSPSDYRNQRKI